MVNLNYTKIVSPVDGVVISRAVELSQTVLGFNADDFPDRERPDQNADRFQCSRSGCRRRRG